MDVRDPKWAFINGHAIGTTVLFPAVGYLYLAWTIFADKDGADVKNFPIEFRNVHFRRLTIIDGSNPVKFQFNILHESGEFEIHEGGELVAEGRLRKVEEFPKDLFSFTTKSVPSLDHTLSNFEFYKEMNLRGYNFNDDFRSIFQIHDEGMYVPSNGLNSCPISRIVIQVVPKEIKKKFPTFQVAGLMLNGRKTGSLFWMECVRWGLYACKIALP